METREVIVFSGFIAACVYKGTLTYVKNGGKLYCQGHSKLISDDVRPQLTGSGSASTSQMAPTRYKNKNVLIAKYYIL